MSHIVRGTPRMSDQLPQPPVSAPRKAWYMKWWVWLIAAAVVFGGISAIINPPKTTQPADSAAQPSQTIAAEPTASETPTASAPLDLESFLTTSGVAFKSARIDASKAWIYVPTETTSEQAQQIANNAMLYICDQAKQAGKSFPAANRVEVTDGVSVSSPGYKAADHPSGFVTDEVCKG